MPEARYTYRCAKCGGSVSKDACRKGGPGLHGWSCATCGRGVKVGRRLLKEKSDGERISLEA